MSEIACFGEALIDFLAAPPRRAGEPWHYLQHAGGAPANTAVAVARLGGSVSFLGMLADDPFGDFLLGALVAAGVGVEGVRRTQDGQTALAFVCLDLAGERSFRFYGDRGAHRLFRPDDFLPTAFDSLKLFHMGSNTLTRPASYESTRSGLLQARAAGAWISMDLNLRPALWPDVHTMRTTVEGILPDVHILKMSRDELACMAESTGSSERWIEHYLACTARLVLVTDGGRPISFFTRERRGIVPAWPVKIRDATAAGDAFSGGLLCLIAEAVKQGDGIERWLEAPEALESALRFAAACGALAVTRIGSFDAMPERGEVEAFLEDRT